LPPGQIRGETPPLGACARCRRPGLHLAVRAMIFGLWA
jgi:hypothetical protein